MLLALDTATATASLALYDFDRGLLLAEQTWQARRRHTQDLLVVAQSLLDLFDLAPLDLRALAVTTGPGSFTGVRVGISTVKGMAIGLPQPPRVVGVPTLSVTAAPWLAAAWSTSPVTVVCAVIQAGRARHNWCFFGPEDLLYRPTVADHGQGSTADLIAVLEAHGAPAIWLVGEVDAALLDAASGIHHVTVIDAVGGLRRAGYLARFAALLLSEGVIEGAESLVPLYLRAP